MKRFSTKEVISRSCLIFLMVGGISLFLFATSSVAEIKLNNQQPLQNIRCIIKQTEEGYFLNKKGAENPFEKQIYIRITDFADEGQPKKYALDVRTDANINYTDIPGENRQASEDLLTAIKKDCSKIIERQYTDSSVNDFGPSPPQYKTHESVSIKEAANFSALCTKGDCFFNLSSGLKFFYTTVKNSSANNTIKDAPFLPIDPARPINLALSTDGEQADQSDEGNVTDVNTLSELKKNIHQEGKEFSTENETREDTNIPKHMAPNDAPQKTVTISGESSDKKREAGGQSLLQIPVYILAIFLLGFFFFVYRFRRGYFSATPERNIEPLKNIIDHQQPVDNQELQPAPQKFPSFEELAKEITESIKKELVILKEEMNKISNDKISEEIKTFSEDLGRLEDNVNIMATQLHAANQDYKRSLKATQMKIADLSNQIDQDKEIIKEATNSISELEESKVEIEILQQKISHFNDTNKEKQNLEKKVFSLEAKYSESVKEKEIMVQQTDEIQKELKNLQKEKIELADQQTYWRKQLIEVRYKSPIEMFLLSVVSFLDALESEGNQSVQLPEETIEFFNELRELSTVQMAENWREAEENLFERLISHPGREATASIFNIIYWNHWLGMHQPIQEEANNVWRHFSHLYLLKGFALQTIELPGHTPDTAMDYHFSHEEFYLKESNDYKRYLQNAYKKLLGVVVEKNSSLFEDFAETLSALDESRTRSTLFRAGNNRDFLRLEESGYMAKNADGAGVDSGNKPKSLIL